MIQLLITGTVSMTIPAVVMVKFFILSTVWSVWWSEAKYKCDLYQLGPFLSKKSL